MDDKSRKQPSVDETPTLLKYADFNYGEFFKRRNVRILITGLIVIGALLFGFWLSSIFVPLLVALLIAYILNPLVVWLEKKGISRLKAVVAIFASFFAVATLTLALVIPAILNNVGDFAKNAHTYPEKIESAARSAIHWYNERAPESARINEDAVSSEYLRNVLKSEFEQIGAKQHTPSGTPEEASTPGELALAIFGTFLKWMLFITLVPFYTFYFMMGLDRIWAGIRDHLPGRQRDRILNILKEIHTMVAAFFRGRITVCLIISVLMIALYVACGVPFSVVLGLTGGFGVIIPFFPIIASLTPALLLMLIGGGHSTTAIVAVIAGFAIVQSFEQFWLTPKILGKAVELHPVTLIVGVFVMANLFGFFGALLAVPLTAIAKIIGRELILPYFRSLASEDPTRSISRRADTPAPPAQGT